MNLFNQSLMKSEFSLFTPTTIQTGRLWKITFEKDRQCYYSWKFIVFLWLSVYYKKVFTNFVLDLFIFCSELNLSKM